MASSSIDLFGSTSEAFSKTELSKIINEGGENCESNVKYYLAKYFIPIIEPTGFLMHSPDDNHKYTHKKKTELLEIIGSKSTYTIKRDDKSIDKTINYGKLLTSPYFENVKLNTDINKPIKY